MSGREPEADPELEAVARLLDEAADQEAIEEVEADALADAPGLDRVESTLRKAWGGAEGEVRGTKPAPRMWTWKRIAIVAAAAGVLAYVGVRSGSDGKDDGPSGNYLADPTVEVVEPPERAARWDRIEWKGPEGATYRVGVRSALDGTELLAPVQVRASRVLQLTAEQTAAWPARIRIEVELRRADGSWDPAPSRVSERDP